MLERSGFSLDTWAVISAEDRKGLPFPLLFLSEEIEEARLCLDMLDLKAKEQQDAGSCS